MQSRRRGAALRSRSRTRTTSLEECCRSYATFVLKEGQQALVIGLAGDAATEVDGDAVEPAAGLVSPEFGFDVALERLARGVTAGVAIVGVKGGFDGWQVGGQATPWSAAVSARASPMSRFRSMP